MNTLVLDIETSPLVALIWRTGKQYVGPENVIEDWHIMSFTAKWLKPHKDADKLIYLETRDKNDRPLLEKLWELFNSADVVITQNGKSFDEPMIRARMMLHGFQPYKPFKHHDTYIQNKDKAFTSHSLAYLSDKFCTKYKKLKHKMFSGLSLWKECLGIKITYNPNPKAWAEMRKYNNYDVLSTEELYLKTRGWSKDNAPAVFEGTDERLCKYCGEYRLVKDNKKFNIKKQRKFYWMRCTACGKYQQGPEVKE